MDISALWLIFSISFITALSGACAPGPLLVYTIMKSVSHLKKGYLMGALIIGGHAILEAGIITLILLGFLYILQIPFIIKIISLLGCLFLLYFGIIMIINVARGKVSTEFLKGEETKAITKFKTFDNPVLGGIIVSMSNPYWWIWWATIGSATLIKFNITMKNWQGLFAFFIGHELGDFAWYIPVSVLAFLGRKRLNKTIYYLILIVCAVFMILFGLYLGIPTLITIQAI